ncbi:MAG: hypothetical protein AAFX99_26160, partial [Myxococcota bacterium]
MPNHAPSSINIRLIALREWLHASPSLDVWLRLWFQLLGWPDPDSRTIALDYARRIIDEHAAHLPGTAAIAPILVLWSPLTEPALIAIAHHALTALPDTGIAAPLARCLVKHRPCAALEQQLAQRRPHPSIWDSAEADYTTIDAQRIAEVETLMEQESWQGMRDWSDLLAQADDRDALLLIAEHRIQAMEATTPIGDRHRAPHYWRELIRSFPDNDPRMLALQVRRLGQRGWPLGDSVAGQHFLYGNPDLLLEALAATVARCDGDDHAPSQPFRRLVLRWLNDHRSSSAAAQVALLGLLDEDIHLRRAALDTLSSYPAWLLAPARSLLSCPDESIASLAAELFTRVPSPVWRPALTRRLTVKLSAAPRRKLEHACWALDLLQLAKDGTDAALLKHLRKAPDTIKLPSWLPKRLVHIPLAHSGKALPRRAVVWLLKRMTALKDDRTDPIVTALLPRLKTEA